MKSAAVLMLLMLLGSCVGTKSINVDVNKVHYVKDIDDRWKAPEVFFKEGGDCEDYAIAKKYLFNRDNLKVRDLRLLHVMAARGVHHMVLAEFDGRDYGNKDIFGGMGDPKIYDNQTNYVYRLSETRYIPVYFIKSNKIYNYLTEKTSPIPDWLKNKLLRLPVEVRM